MNFSLIAKLSFIYEIKENPKYISFRYWKNSCSFSTKIDWFIVQLFTHYEIQGWEKCGCYCTTKYILRLAYSGWKGTANIAYGNNLEFQTLKSTQEAVLLAAVSSSSVEKGRRENFLMFIIIIKEGFMIWL